jgi:hypothetical protein
MRKAAHLFFSLQRRQAYLRAILCLCLTFPTALYAQSSTPEIVPPQLRGRLIDRRSGEPLSSMSVAVGALHLQTQSDWDGRFVMPLSKAKAGDTLSLTVSRPQMEPSKVCIHLATGTRDTQVTIALDLGDVATVMRPPNHCGCVLPDQLPIDLSQLIIQAPKTTYLHAPNLAPNSTGWQIDSE